MYYFFFSSRRRHTRSKRDWSSDVCSSDLAGSKTFLRTDATVVVKGRNEKSTWSEIEINSHVRVRFEERDGKLYAKRVHIGRAHVAGKVESVNGRSEEH